MGTVSGTVPPKGPVPFAEHVELEVAVLVVLEALWLEVEVLVVPEAEPVLELEALALPEEVLRVELAALAVVNADKEELVAGPDDAPCKDDAALLEDAAPTAGAPVFEKEMTAVAPAAEAASSAIVTKVRAFETPGRLLVRRLPAKVRFFDAASAFIGYEGAILYRLVSITYRAPHSRVGHTAWEASTAIRSARFARPSSLSIVHPTRSPGSKLDHLGAGRIGCPCRRGCGSDQGATVSETIFVVRVVEAPW